MQSMNYQFNKFSLDVNKQELTFNRIVIPLSKQLFDLLFLFVQNPNKVFSKDDIIAKVWSGKYVTENSIDKSISKLRKLFSEHNQDDFIKTSYGKGFIFVSDVSLLDESPTGPGSNPKVSRFKAYVIGAMLLFIVLIVAVVNKRSTENKPNSLLLIISSADASGNEGWLNTSAAVYLGQVFGMSDNVYLKNIDQRPKYQNREQYISTQWRISPNLQVVTSKTIQNDHSYTVELSVTNKSQLKQSRSFTNQNLALAMRAASKWLSSVFVESNPLGAIDSQIPNDSYLIELYMHGLASYAQGEFDSAENYYQLCLQKKPDFLLAKLELARVKSALGKQQQGLALLDTVLKTDTYPQLKIEAQSIKGLIYNILGKDEVNRDLYKSVLSEYANKDYPQLKKIKLNLSFTYTKLTEFKKALGLLNELESSIDERLNPELLASTYQKQASILQKMGYIEEAQKSAQKSLSLYSKLGDLLGEAKIHTTLARIATHQSKYMESIHHLEQSLAICKTLDYKLGIGATLNELIYVLMVQGYFEKASLLNQEMQKIAIEIGYNAMLQISKQFAVDLSRVQKQWVKSEMGLKAHLRFAELAENKSALLTNKLLSLDLILDQNKVEGVIDLISQVQAHIDETGEVRLQPRLNKQLARLYLLQGQQETAVTLLLTTKELAKNTQDGEVIIEVNNLLAEQYLDLDNPQKALMVLEDSFEFDPFSYPLMLLKSKANFALGKRLLALDLANECKLLSNEWWSIDDERYLSTLVSSAE